VFGAVAVGSALLLWGGSAGAHQAGVSSRGGKKHCKPGWVLTKAHRKRRCIKKLAPVPTAAQKATALLFAAFSAGAPAAFEESGTANAEERALADSILGRLGEETDILEFQVGGTAPDGGSLGILAVGKGGEGGSWNVRAGLTVSQPLGSPVPEPPFDAQGNPQGLLDVSGPLNPYYRASPEALEQVTMGLNVKLVNGSIVSPGFSYYPHW